MCVRKTFKEYNIIPFLNDAIKHLDIAMDKFYIYNVLNLYVYINMTKQDLVIQQDLNYLILCLFVCLFS